MFAMMVADKTYEDLMDVDKTYNLKGRMAIDYSDERKKERFKIALENYTEINDCLKAMK